MKKGDYKVEIDSKVLARFIKLLLKYVVPIVLGWLEGDTHTLQTLLENLA